MRILEPKTPRPGDLKNLEVNREIIGRAVGLTRSDTSVRRIAAGWSILREFFRIPYAVVGSRLVWHPEVGVLVLGDYEEGGAMISGFHVDSRQQYLDMGCLPRHEVVAALKALKVARGAGRKVAAKALADLLRESCGEERNERAAWVIEQVTEHGSFKVGKASKANMGYVGTNAFWAVYGDLGDYPYFLVCAGGLTASFFVTFEVRARIKAAAESAPKADRPGYEVRDYNLEGALV